jgi:hypothetical protein
VAEFYDAAVSGADAIDARAGFAAMLKRIEGNGVLTIIGPRELLLPGFQRIGCPPRCWI